MSTPSEPPISINSWLEEELYQDYVHDRGAVDASWKAVFDHNGHTSEEQTPDSVTAPAAAPAVPADVPSITAITKSAPPPAVSAADQLVPLKGALARLAENMTASLAVPTATSQRTIAVKVIDENRRLLNEWRDLHAKPKISYTTIIAWALVKAIKDMPGINHAYAEVDSQPHRLVRNEINIGIAVDIAGRDGHRQLVVPSIKNAGAMTFRQFLDVFDDIVARARTGKLTPDDFKGTTISLTNPGTVGTLGSVPRLMPGQGAIIATGSIDFPAEFEGVSDETRAQLGISKVMTVTCTYDHRVIQGAESGMFLGRLHSLLDGADEFYDDIFLETGMPYHPVRWQPEARKGAPIAGAEPRFDEFAKQAAVVQLINAYRVRGHLIADFDPLGAEPSYHPELDPSNYGLTIWDLDRQFITGNLARHGRGGQVAAAPLRKTLQTLRQTYCAKIGCEYMHIQHPEEKRWLQEHMEPQANNWALSPELRQRILLRLLQGETFENFLHTRFVGQKRFSLEGAESAMVILDELMERAADAGVQEIVLGMAHRGRLNVLANLVGKTMAQVFGEFEGNLDPDSSMGSGDVKYHLGASGIQRTSEGLEIKVSMAPNPSHLEAVDPVVTGIVRAKQTRMRDTSREKVLGVLVHGDAAFAGQGVVAETLNLSQLSGYTTGGTVHLIIDNQIGFTTTPEEGRSTTYCTDVARTVQAPIFHVNGDDPEACVRAIQVAFDFRQQFKKDVVIDMICYRKYGHNEGDDPSYTQPLMYRKIKDHPSVANQYAERLLREKISTKEWIERTRKGIHDKQNEAHEEAVRRGERWELQEVTSYEEPQGDDSRPRTAVDQALLERVITGLTTFPETFTVHPKLKAFVEKRREFLKGGVADWALGEALAFGTLAMEGTPVRLSGQDSGRGTFSQRHLEFFDYETGKQYTPMTQLSKDQARFEVVDSSLSEYGVMGFEFGYSLGDPLTLTLWEAQFGDFANGAQIMIDQFIAACEAKWGQPSGLALLLPHGFEGQGPEHSSARLERFLQLCAESNMQVCNVTTPAQYFHLLRRQMYGGQDRRGVRKPLVLITPKSMLRHPKMVSTLPDFTHGHFETVLSDPGVTPDRVTKLLLCTGKIYFELQAAREQRDAAHVSIVRLEQIYPWPQEELEKILWRYPSTTDVIWVQEEPRNMGAYLFVQDKLQPMLDATRRELRYVGRAEAASTAAGSYKRHSQEQAAVIEDAFSTGPARVRRYKVVAKKRK
jgi:multifunctional 2-oxoglutarate metabolism enzyme